MANARIVYDPGSGSRNLDFPEEFSDVRGPRRSPVRTLNESAGGVVAVQFEHFRDVFELYFDRMPRNVAFEEEAVSFWSHAGRGKSFDVAFDSADMVSRVVRVAVAAGATRVLVDSSAGFVVGQRYLVESVQEGGFARERFVVTAKDVASAPSIDLDRALIYGYAVNDVVRSVDYYRKCVAVQEDDPLVVNAAETITFLLRASTYFDLTVA